jgi:hypothetical protein
MSEAVVILSEAKDLSSFYPRRLLRHVASFGSAGISPA